MKYFALLSAVLFTVVACGGSDHGMVIDEGASGRTGSAGHSGSGAGNTGTGGDSGAATGGDVGDGGDAGGTTESLAPAVVISSPAALDSPSSAKVLTEDQVNVVCTVTPATASPADAVLVSSVKIQMFGADGKQIGMDGTVMATTNANEYSVHFVLVGIVPTGAVSFKCIASDQAQAPHTASATVKTFYDGGPTIAITNPADKSAHALGPILFKFSALPAALAPADDGAAVESVTLSVNGVNITTLAPIAGTPGFYQSDVDLSDAKTFAPKPVGSVPVAITATNKRGTTATQHFTFVVDSTGPVISVISPPISTVTFVGGQTTIQFAVTDEVGGSGVDPTSVQVTINAEKTPSSYEEGNYWHLAPDGKTFSYTFNTLDYPAQLGVTVHISAFDKAGNMAAGLAPFYYLDNIPPIIDLDPAPLQERTKSGQNQICSEFFDPLGESPNDLTTIPSVNEFRALVWDRGNVADGQGISFYSDVDTTVGVRLYFQQDVTKPLLKNFKGMASGVCDDVVDPTLPFISLMPIAPAGSADYDASAPVNASCIAGTATTPPTYVCGDNPQISTLTRVVQHEAAASGTPVSVIYGFQPDATFCAGGQYDLTNVVRKDGWVCAAVVAQDKIGNRAVSAPIRLCLDAHDEAGVNYTGTPSCATGAKPPSCVAPLPAGCVWPPHFPAALIEKL